MSQTLVGVLVPEFRLNQAFQTKIRQLLAGCHATGSVNAGQQAAFADPKPPGQFSQGQGLAKMVGEKVQGLPPNRTQSPSELRET